MLIVRIGSKRSEVRALIQGKRSGSGPFVGHGIVAIYIGNEMIGEVSSSKDTYVAIYHSTGTAGSFTGHFSKFFELSGPCLEGAVADGIERVGLLDNII